MIHRLARRASDVDSYVATGWTAVAIEPSMDLPGKRPNPRLLVVGQGKEVLDMSTWNDEGVPRTDRIGIRDRHCQSALKDNLARA